MARRLQPSAYVLTDSDLTIPNVPAAPFTLEIETECDPVGNTELSGLYQSNGVFCTQCEAEGFRRITYFYDRPDVMTRYTVRDGGEQGVLPHPALQRKSPGRRRHRGNRPALRRLA